jgi:hypothetical protein
MSAPAQIVLPHGLPLFEAVVVDVADPGRLTIRTAEDAAIVEARNAVLGYQPTAGDRVLCAPSGRVAYVTGVLVASATSAELRAGDAVARVEDGKLVVRGEDGALLVTFDPGTGIARVSSAEVRIEASERLVLASPEVTVEAEKLTHRVTDLVTEAVRISTSADRLDVRVNKLTERAKTAFRDVEDLLQTRAGTLRSIAREGMALFAKRTSIRSEKDTAIDGERVFLG